MKTRTKSKNKTIAEKLDRETAPLHVREKNMDTRKGMIKHKSKHSKMSVNSKLPLYGNPYDQKKLIDAGILNMQTGEITNIGELDMEPDYVKRRIRDNY